MIFCEGDNFFRVRIGKPWSTDETCCVLPDNGDIVSLHFLAALKDVAHCGLESSGLERPSQISLCCTVNGRCKRQCGVPFLI